MGAIDSVAETATGPDLETNVDNFMHGYHKGRAIGGGLFSSDGNTSYGKSEGATIAEAIGASL
jgi:hypothetical protein